MYLRILKKDLKRKKTMNLILFIFIILAATFVASSVNNMLSVSTALDSYFEKAEIPDYFICISYQSESERFDEFAADNGYDSKTLELLQIDPNKMLINGEKFDYNSTSTISTLKNSTKVFNSNDEEIIEVADGEIYMTSEIFNNNNLKVGDTITISSDGKTKEFTLVGSTKDAAFGSSMFSITRMLVSNNDFEFLRSKNSLMLYYISVYTDDSNFINKFNNHDIQPLICSNSSIFKYMYMMDILTAGIILVISMCLILISMVILRFTINFTMSEEFCEIGVMKAIGIQNRKIRGIYIIKYLAISIIGAFIGFTLSIPFKKLLIKDVANNIILGDSADILTNMICAAATALTVMMFCYLCTRKIKKFSPVDAIRNGENGERYNRKGFIHLSKTKLSPVSFIAVNDILSELKRFAAMIVIFALGLLLIILPINTINTLQSDNLITLLSMAQCDHVISQELLLNNNNNKKLIEDNLDNVREYLSENGIKADVFQEGIFKMAISHGDKNNTSMAFQGFGDITAEDYMYEEGSAPKNINEVAVTSLIADSIGAKIGDDVEIKNGDNVKTYIICGLFQSMNNMGEGIRFHQDEQLDYSYMSGSLGIQIRYTDNPDSQTLAKRKTILSEHFTDGKVYNAGEYANYMIGDVASQLDSVKQMILIVVICINILVTVLMVKSFITKEKGEIAILKAIGFKNSSLVAWQTLRIGIVLLIAIIPASLLSTPLLHLTVEPIFKKMGAMSIEFEIKPLEVYVIYPLIVLSVTIFAALITALQLRKISASETSNIE